MAKKREYVYSENAEYQKEYQRTLNRILISFNPRTADDVILWDHLQSKGKGNIVPYIKRLIMEDMKEE